MSCDLGQVHTFGVEGTGSYGAGLARFLTDRNYTVLEVNRPDLSVRYRKGKSDPAAAEMAGRSVPVLCSMDGGDGASSGDRALAPTL